MDHSKILITITQNPCTKKKKKNLAKSLYFVLKNGILNFNFPYTCFEACLIPLERINLDIYT